MTLITLTHFPRMSCELHISCYIWAGFHLYCTSRNSFAYVLRSMHRNTHCLSLHTSCHHNTHDLITTHWFSSQHTISTQHTRSHHNTLVLITTHTFSSQHTRSHHNTHVLITTHMFSSQHTCSHPRSSLHFRVGTVGLQQFLPFAVFQSRCFFAAKRESDVDELWFGCKVPPSSDHE